MNRESALRRRSANQNSSMGKEDNSSNKHKSPSESPIAIALVSRMVRNRIEAADVCRIEGFEIKGGYRSRLGGEELQVGGWYRK